MGRAFKPAPPLLVAVSCGKRCAVSNINNATRVRQNLSKRANAGASGRGYAIDQIAHREGVRQIIEVTFSIDRGDCVGGLVGINAWRITLL